MNMNTIGRWEIMFWKWLLGDVTNEKSEQSSLALAVEEMHLEFERLKDSYEQISESLKRKEEFEGEMTNKLQTLYEMVKREQSQDKNSEIQTKLKSLEDEVRTFQEKENSYKVEIQQLQELLEKVENEKDQLKEQINEEQQQKKMISETEEKKQNKKKSPQLEKRTPQQKGRNLEFERLGGLPIQEQSKTTMFNPFRYSNYKGEKKK
jgi:predicted  nucleic acid-binding Zn-ribbon protein